MDIQANLAGASPIYVLVEEDEAIRSEWLRLASQKGLKLLTYPTADWFLGDLSSGVVKGNERFYLDQDMHGVRSVGVSLAREVKRRWPRTFTSLVTAYPKALFRRELAEAVLDDVYGKYPSPFDNPAFSAFEQKFEQEFWMPFLTRTGAV